MISNTMEQGNFLSVVYNWNNAIAITIICIGSFEKKAEELPLHTKSAALEGSSTVESWIGRIGPHSCLHQRSRR